jgi:hypothetical protein
MHALSSNVESQVERRHIMLYRTQIEVYGLVRSAAKMKADSI